MWLSALLSLATEFVDQVQLEPCSAMPHAILYMCAGLLYDTKVYFGH